MKNYFKIVFYYLTTLLDNTMKLSSVELAPNFHIEKSNFKLESGKLHKKLYFIKCLFHFSTNLFVSALQPDKLRI